MIKSGRVDRDLKCWPAYFEDVISGRKQFEVRLREPPDNVFFVGELLKLREWTNAGAAPGRYTGREVTVEVTYVCPLDQIGCAPFDGMGIRMVAHG